MRQNRHKWVKGFFPESLLAKPMFGMEALYFEGKLVLVLGDKQEPWSGLLVCTHHETKGELQKDFPALTPHSILPKWLYLSERSPEFEEYAESLARLILRRDPRIGVEPKLRRSGKKGKGKARVRASRAGKRSKGGRRRRRGNAASAR